MHEAVLDSMWMLPKGCVLGRQGQLADVGRLAVQVLSIHKKICKVLQ